MTDRSPDDLDRRLRGAFEDDPAAVERVVRAVSTGLPRSPRRERAWTVPILAAACLAVATLAVWSSRPGPASTTLGAPNASFTNGVLILPLSDGTTAILGPGTRDERPPDGFGIVLISGESQ